MTLIIKIRGHHIPSILEYCKIRCKASKKDPFYNLRANGYDDNYIENKRKLCEQIYQNPNQQIKVVNTLDDLCKMCNKKEKKCSNLLFTDAFIAAQYKFTSGDTYTAQRFLNYVN